MTVVAELCPAFKGKWGREGKCNLVPIKVSVPDASCTPPDQADFQGHHLQVEITKPPLVIETEGPLRRVKSSAQTICDSRCPLVNVQTPDRRRTGLGSGGIIFQAKQLLQRIF